jgi:hypothetical protein
MTLYSTLYNRALAQITDPLLAQLPEEDLEIMLHDWLMDAIVEPVVGEYDFSDRDEELKQFNFNISDRDQKILSIHMVRGWLAPQIRSVTLTQQVYSGKETKLGLVSTVRCIGKPCSVFLRICWEALRVIIPKQRDEICSYGMV